MWIDTKSATEDTEKDGENVVVDGDMEKAGTGGGGGTGSGSFGNPGIVLDGAADYLKIPRANGIYNNAEQTIVVGFVPEFDPYDDSYSYLYDSTNGLTYSLVKKDNAGSNTLPLTLGGTVVANIAVADYENYWIPHGLNVLIVGAEDGSTNIRLNGELVIDSDATSWSPEDPAEIFIGCRYTLGSLFDGTIFAFAALPFKVTPTQAREITNYLQSEYSRYA